MHHPSGFSATKPYRKDKHNIVLGLTRLYQKAQVTLQLVSHLTFDRASGPFLVYHKMDAPKSRFDYAQCPCLYVWLNWHFRECFSFPVYHKFSFSCVLPHGLQVAL